MKRVLGLALLIGLVLVQASFAELMTTANPLGKGKWGFLGTYLSDSNVGNTSGWSASTIGGFIGYGLTSKADLYVTAGSFNVNGLPAGLSSTMGSYGAFLKYTVVEEGAGVPVSVALGGLYRSLSWVHTLLGTQQGSQVGVGVGISKMLIPFIPYGGIVYRSTQYSNTPYQNQIDLTVGTALAWSQQGAMFLEYTQQSITPNGGSGYGSGQVGLGVGYKI